MKNRSYFNSIIRLVTTGCLLLLFLPEIGAKERVRIHSHNDYRQCVPFYQAYAQQLFSIEADIHAKDGKLWVAHDPEEIDQALTLDELYLEPVISLFERQEGRAWKGKNDILQLMIELKTPADPALDLLIEKLDKYPGVFDPQVNPYAVRIVITGKVPAPETFVQYPRYISFDGLPEVKYTPEQLERIALISLPFRGFARWNGKGSMLAAEIDKIKEAIEYVHALGKPIRFWGTPDGLTAWNTFYSLGVDIINTDRPEACAAFFRDFDNKNFSVTQPGTELSQNDEVVTTDRLDKLTAGFQGFDKSTTTLTKPVDIYMPTYKNDGSNKRVRNVIFLIGDGMGLTQVAAAGTVNHGLTLFNMKHIGLQKNTAKDQYTTDSAASGSALATGKKNSNRHISISDEGEDYLSVIDVLAPAGYACGVITLGNLADATPAAFYGHATDRDDSDAITDYLLDGRLTLLAGSGMEVFTTRKDGKDFVRELERTGYRVCTHADEINKDQDKVICVDERMGSAATEYSLPLLAEVTRAGIDKLSAASGKGFFLMVEGAKIDYAGHANSLPGSIMETLSFDRAVAEALKFADTNGETLVIVTADHETGGLTLIDGDQERGLITAVYVTDDHTPVMLPVYAYGPGAAAFNGVYENTEIFNKIMDILKFK